MRKEAPATGASLFSEDFSITAIPFSGSLSHVLDLSLDNQ
jgi:hypothetical protein